MELYIILASKSERRKAILEREGFKFEIYLPHVEEKDIIGREYDAELVNKCAREKAKNAYAELKEKGLPSLMVDIGQATSIDENPNLIKIIVSCDTVVVNDGVIIGKPKDKQDAIRILKSLSGRRHRVISAVCICKDRKFYVDNETTYVTFRKISDDEIDKFVDERKPYDKSGAYAIQDEKYKFAEKIEGSIDNVVGFPIEKFKDMIKNLNSL